MKQRDPKRKVLGPYAKLVQRLRTSILPIDFNGFLRFRGSMLGGKSDLVMSWKHLRSFFEFPGGIYKRLGKPLGGLLGHLGSLLGHLGSVMPASSVAVEAP